jgi:hypothetical protein
MADNGKDVEILLEDPPVVKNEPEVIVEAAEENTATVQKAERREISGEEGIDALKKRLEESERARMEAENRAREAHRQAQMSDLRAGDSDLQLVNSAIHSVKRENDILKANLQTFMASEDYGKVAEIQEALSVNAAKLLQLENGKAAMESAPKQQIQQPIGDPVEQFASQLSPRSAAWVRRNPQCVTDPRLFQKMIAAHNLAVADGFEPDSDDYFSFVEDTIKVSRREAPAKQESALSEASAPTQRRSAPPAAPVTRSGTGTGSRPDVVRLTAEEREMARMMQMSDKEYAVNKLALKREGKLN